MPQLQILPYKDDETFHNNINHILSKLTSDKTIDKNHIIVTECTYKNQTERSAQEYAKRYNLKFMNNREIDNHMSRQVENVSKTHNIPYDKALKWYLNERMPVEALYPEEKKPCLPYNGYIIVSIGGAPLNIMFNDYRSISTNKVIHIQNSTEPTAYTWEKCENLKSFEITLDQFQIPQID
ncbi:MAG: hypothetical protein IJE43_22230 [Alphaproteobacteria bacterium]|nr:hypothetical protein [Alphaproteobacteria bacterium]MBQ6887685.1 hypothetical protein [Lachnospiraceae bacterium]